MAGWLNGCLCAHRIAEGLGFRVYGVGFRVYGFSVLGKVYMCRICQNNDKLSQERWTI